MAQNFLPSFIACGRNDGAWKTVIHSIWVLQMVGTMRKPICLCSENGHFIRHRAKRFLKPVAEKP
jgi:hypothetical protein